VRRYRGHGQCGVAGAGRMQQEVGHARGRGRPPEGQQRVAAERVVHALQVRQETVLLRQARAQRPGHLLRGVAKLAPADLLGQSVTAPDLVAVEGVHAGGPGAGVGLALVRGRVAAEQLGVAPLLHCSAATWAATRGERTLRVGGQSKHVCTCGDVSDHSGLRGDGRRRRHQDAAPPPYVNLHRSKVLWSALLTCA
jgi:hypothetical protein